MRNSLFSSMTKADAQVAMTGIAGIAMFGTLATKTTKTP